VLHLPPISVTIIPVILTDHPSFFSWNWDSTNWLFSVSSSKPLLSLWLLPPAVACRATAAGQQQRNGKLSILQLVAVWLPQFHWVRLVMTLFTMPPSVRFSKANGMIHSCSEQHWIFSSQSADWGSTAWILPLRWWLRSLPIRAVIRLQQNQSLVRLGIMLIMLWMSHAQRMSSLPWTSLKRRMFVS